MGEMVLQAAAGPVCGAVVVPGSRSQANRALVAAALAEGTSTISNMLFADDTRRMMEVLRGLGVSVTVDERAGTAEISGCRGYFPECEGRLFAGGSGTTMRFALAMVGLGQGTFELDGTSRMRQRPIGDMVDALRTLGVQIEYLGTPGFPPLRVHPSRLGGGYVEFRSPASSQMISGLLLVAPYAVREVLIRATGRIPSRPYLQMTVSVMQDFGVIVLDGYEGTEARFIVESPQRYHALRYAVEPDATNAGYFLAAAAITGGRVTIPGLGTKCLQGDVGFAAVLARIGCEVEHTPDALTVYGPPDGRLIGIDVDLNDMPDLVQTLACVALFAQGPTRIRNVANLRWKETDRLAALHTELSRLGAEVTVGDSELIILPPSRPKAARIRTYDDHRMAMSFAVAGLRIPGLVIENPECCMKTFPGFFETMQQLIQGVSRRS